MKKTYIAPEAKAYTVSAKCGNLTATSQIDTNQDNQFVKEENEEVGIWDLY